MPGQYAIGAKVARMTATRDAIDIGGGGRLEVGSTGFAAILSQHPFATPCGTVAGAGVLTFTGSALTDASANASGDAREARIVRADGTVIRDGMSVGIGGLTNWAASTAFTVGQMRRNGTEAYKCVTAGTSASSGGPTGTGSSITDGTAAWKHMGSATPDVNLVTTEIVAGQPVTINGPVTLTHG